MSFKLVSFFYVYISQNRAVSRLAVTRRCCRAATVRYSRM